MALTATDLLHLKSWLAHFMIGDAVLNLDVLETSPERTVVHMPYVTRLLSGFHPSALHAGALFGLASTASIIHALQVTRPDATGVNDWMIGSQPWILNASTLFHAKASSDVVATASVTAWNHSLADMLLIKTDLTTGDMSLTTGDMKLVSTVVTQHHVPASRCPNTHPWEPGGGRGWMLAVGADGRCVVCGRGPGMSEAVS